MLLAVDAGNSFIKLAIYDGDRMVKRWRLASDSGRSRNEYARLFSELIASEVNAGTITGAAVACVAPDVLPELCGFLRDWAGAEPLVIDASLDCGVSLNYRPVTDLGPDRVADVAGAAAKYGRRDMVVIDLGTATTFNAIRSGSHFLGGAICPGMGVFGDWLASRGAQLFVVDFEAPELAIADNTRQALQSGIVYGQTAMVEGMVRRFRVELAAPDCLVIATGGFSSDLPSEQFTFPVRVDSNLTLDGIAELFRRNSVPG